MGGHYADPVDVQRRDHNPAAFCWRGRIYLVQGVRAHWVETGPWWQSASVRALLAEPANESGCSVVASGTSPPVSTDREFWQVEARPRRGTAPGVYELCADWSSGRGGSWSVTTGGYRTSEGSRHGQS